MKAKLNFRLIFTIAAIAFAATATSPLHADDTEIFFTPPGTSQIVKPNIMFIIDNSGSMGNWVDDTGTTRMDVVQTVTNSLIDKMQDINVGVMKFNIQTKCDDNNENCSRYTESGGHILSPPVDVVTNAADLKTLVNALEPIGNTPLSETLAEAARYFRGDAPFYDDKPTASVVSSEGGPYVSPVSYQCQKNYAVFLTDGAPTADDTDAAISTYIDQNCGTADSTDTNKSCLDDVAGFLADGDLSSSLEGDQYVITHTVGFTTAQDLLSDTAAAGKGNYYLANDQAGLEAAFDKIYQAVRAQGTTYVSPGVAINTFDRLNHLNTLYYALFQSDKGAIWNGNLKRYKLEIREDANGDKTAVIVDENGNAAIDNTTGFFKETAQSWWSPVADGPDVALGGAASQLPAATADRKVYSNLASNNTDLTAAGNQVAATNTNLTKADFGDSTMADAEFAKVVSWTRGVDVNDEDGDNDTTDARKLLADPLHSVPQLVIYNATTDPQATTIYYGDNQGFIHAVNGNTGESQFSFVPRELLTNQVPMMNSTDASSKLYGMDGSVVKWIHDKNVDGAINAADNDFVRIFSGMRRGGKSYYALDVTSPDSPSLMWSITGGANGTAGFEELAQTWSTPIKTTIRDRKNVIDVLIFGGGYDVDQDNATVRTADDEGRALYIVNANTGELIWRAGLTGTGADLELDDMQYSIPASPKVIDVNGDGSADQVYVGDMGGQIFRFDIGVTGNNDDMHITGGRIADLGVTHPDLTETAEEKNRRFYHTPDIFGLKQGGKRYLGLVIGSGYQAHPLDTVVKDRIYMLKIDAVSSAPLDPTDETETTVLYQTLTEEHLYDATDNTIQEGDTETARTDAATALAGKQGWFIRLTRAGEKVLSAATTVNNEIYITTYEPKASTNPCFPPTGTSRMYHLSAFDGTAVRNYTALDSDVEGELTKEDREVELSTAGLPPTPQRMRVDDTDVICIGTECETIKTVKGVVETYWYED
ncbi:PilC/PilY family type IV pilus protein [Marinobacter orientalis]|uniref:VWA domain-containing protein n=1 Tax=Marinobacter orientalis TaxID=1928859 RepID=A0A7Y0RFW7_9GAMM|nr:PilC/PilY family type IV pilus protein [Marinobacter orientalis]NMT65519.1 VWA domain-containing protein [Marinobacter orientalis]TGX47142.1 VWA domain-containing protein [Marinobacter orientalis]